MRTGTGLFGFSTSGFASSMEKSFSAEAREDCSVPNCSASSWIGSKKELM